MTTLLTNHANDQFRNHYFRSLKGRVDDKTLDAKMRHIVEFERFNAYRDFLTLTEEEARAFRDHVHQRTSERGNKPLSPSSIVHTLRDVKAFFEWLTKLKGTRRLNLAAVEYLTASNRMKVGARTGADPYVPTPGDIRAAIDAIPPTTLINRRNRALIAILILTGIRVGAAVSLRLKHIDLENRRVDQDASEVGTKFGKNMLTAFFPVDAYFATVVIEWIQERTVNGAGPDAPLFPAMPLRFGRPNTALPLEHCWTTSKPAQTVVRKACQAAGITEFGPHSIRSTLTLLGAQLGLNREAEKAWSQNLGHDHLATTYDNYMKVTTQRQHQILHKLADRSLNPEYEARLIEKFRQLDSRFQANILELVEKLNS